MSTLGFFKDLFKDKDKKSVYGLAVLFAAGILLLLLSGGLFNTDSGKTEEAAKEEAVIKMPETASDAESVLEKKLEETLSLVEGAGKVKAMLTLTHGKETVVQQDTRIDESHTDETDSTGGRRLTSLRNSEEQTVMIRQSDGSEVPLILLEAEPKVEGVIIIAEGGSDILVKDALIKAAQTVLGIESHKVQVLKMKS
jgi:stage III sporulation protein AG